MGMRRARPLMSSGTRAVSVVLLGIRKETTPPQVSHEALLECHASPSREHGITDPVMLSEAKHLWLLFFVSPEKCSGILRFAQNDILWCFELETTAAILLRKRKLSDTSLIVSWCTESFGCIQTVAKGARRPKSPFAGKLDLFFEAEISIVRSRKSDLHTLTEIVLTNPFPGIRSNYVRTQTAAYFVELIEICTERDHREPELFTLLRRAFGYLDVNDPTQRAVSHFETELARIAGVHDSKKLKADPAFALGNLFGRLPLSRAPLLKTLAAEAKNSSR
jgi:DNA repair protein RecO (recombination protein O)